MQKLDKEFSAPMELYFFILLSWGGSYSIYYVKLFYILCITKNGEIVLMLRIKLGFFPQKLLLLFPQLSR